MGYDMYIEGIPEADKERATELGKKSSALYHQRNDLPKEQHPTRETQGLDFLRGTGSEEWWKLHDEAEALQVEEKELDGYFRLNIWGMVKCREAMDQLGMVDWEAGPKWPEAEDYGLEEHPDSEGQWDEATETSTPWAEDSPESKYLKAVEGMKASVPESGLLSGYKFGTNEGWLVTPGEIQGALAMLKDWEQEREDKAGVLYVFEDNLPPWFGEWVGFMRRASEREGFRVY